jgi:methanethiol S-methyltransferase
MKRAVSIGIAATGYGLAMANIAYLIGFLADFGVPKAINSGAFDGDVVSAVVVNVLLVLGFGLHHSVTARPWFKRWWTKWVPPHLERAAYLYMTALMTAVLVVGWRPIPMTLWEVQAAWAVLTIYTLYIAVWLMMLAATFHFGHLGFFGLAQALDRFRAAQPAGPSFSARYLYALVRHPISLGWMVAPWLTPQLSVGQAVFGISVAGYVLVATYFEEADLVAELGDRYRDYRNRVPAFLPHPRRARRRPTTAAVGKDAKSGRSTQLG